MINSCMKLLALTIMLMFASDVKAQFDLGNVISGVLGGKSDNTIKTDKSSSNDLISGLTSIFSSKKQASEKSIVGTWVYAEPAIVLKSDNILSNVAAKVAAGKIEDKLAGVLSKYGIKEGMLSITFNEDGTFTETIGKKTIKGKWTVKDSKLNLTFGTLKPKTIPITTQLEGNQLLFVTDASKLLDFVKNISSKSSNSNIKTITKLMDNVTGMQAGLTMKKK